MSEGSKCRYEVSRAPWLPIAFLALSLSSCTSLIAPDDALGVKAAPDFSQPLTAAMAQMSEDEAAQMSAELSALGNGRRAGTISEADYWVRVGELEALARQHGVDTISRIERPQ